MKFEYQVESIRTPALSMDYHLVPWDSEIFARPVAQVSQLRVTDLSTAHRDYQPFARWCADNAIELTRGRDGRLRGAGGNGGGEAMTAHFRSDVARIDAQSAASNDADLRLHGQIVQTLYVGQGYRYRIRTEGADVWAHANERMDEGASVAVVVPRDALLLFPRATTPG